MKELPPKHVIIGIALIFIGLIVYCCHFGAVLVESKNRLIGLGNLLMTFGIGSWLLWPVVRGSKNG